MLFVNWLKNGGMKKMTREYNFPLPHHFSAFEVMYAPNWLQAMCVWDRLPKDLRDLIMDAYNKSVGLTLEKEDLDRIDDDTWSQIVVLFS